MRKERERVCTTHIYNRDVPMSCLLQKFVKGLFVPSGGYSVSVEVEVSTGVAVAIIAASMARKSSSLM